eukprot:COSAG02_NODE_34566_length_482_cov_0.720627_1_plen_24_part_01
MWGRARTVGGVELVVDAVIAGCAV